MAFFLQGLACNIKRQLLELDLVVLLILYIPFDHLLIEADGGDKIAPSPDAAWWKFLGLLLDPSTAFALEDGQSIGNGKLGRYRDVHVDVLIPNVPGHNLPFLPFADCLEYFLQFCFDVCVSQDFTPEPSGPDQMILADVGTMAQIVYSSVVRQI